MTSQHLLGLRIMGEFEARRYGAKRLSRKAFNRC
jgi:hypothetical protein